jgi:thioredoxin-like negative regulator of GroEL
MHGVAQQYTAAGSASPAVSFGVMDVDVVPEGAAVSSKLGLQQLPMYVIYQDGQEVARLSSSPDRRRLGEVLAQHVAAVSAAGSMQ